MRRRSLTFRLIGYLIFAQLCALVIGWVITKGLVLGGFRPWTSTIDDFAYARMRREVIASLTRDDDGSILIQPTPALRDEMERVPALKFAAFDPSRRTLAKGSSSELARIVADSPDFRLVSMDFYLPDDENPRSVGFVDSLATPVGRVRVAVYGERFRWDDPFNVFIDYFQDQGPPILAVLVIGSAVTWLAVRKALEPLRSVAEGVKLIDVSMLNQRLPDNKAPEEIAPLVEAFNETLARLDVGVTRLRRFTANAAHELRTPLAVLSARLGAPEEPTFKKDLKRDVRRARNIVDQLLSTTRLADQATQVFREVDLSSIAKSVASDAAMLAIKYRRQVEFVAPSTPVLVMGNNLALESVITNLIDNAIRAEPEGGTVLVRVTTNAIVEVVDHGEGIAENDRIMIFEPFWRKSEDTPGAGLGLAIASELIEKHHGHIWVESTPGGGATFKLSIPAVPPK